jgi:hypothetical protein
MTENKIELKPCPFCGEGKIIKIEQSHRNGFTIKCGNCNMGKTVKVLRFSLDWAKNKIIIWQVNTGAEYISSTSRGWMGELVITGYEIVKKPKKKRKVFYRYVNDSNLYNIKSGGLCYLSKDSCSTQNNKIKITLCEEE